MAAPFEEAVKQVSAKFGPDFQLKDKQKEALQHVWDWDRNDKHDLILNLPTGYGKSIVFQMLPDLLTLRQDSADIDRDRTIVLVVCPLNIIQTDQLERLGQLGITSCRLDVACHAHRQVDGAKEEAVSLQEVIAGKYSIVYAHPESLLSAEDGERLLHSSDFTSRVAAVVVDECHKCEEWGEEFRTAFSNLDHLVAYFNQVPLIAMSGTITIQQQARLQSLLCLRSPVILSSNPDRPNIFISKRRRDPNRDVVTAYEKIYAPECDRLFELGMEYPVTLLFLPLLRTSGAVNYVQKLFGHDKLPVSDESVMYAAFYAKIDKESLNIIITELKKPASSPSRIRLIFCTSSIGMGFDSPQVTNIIHSKPPNLISDYFQQIGRAGRQGQESTATLWFNASDLGPKEMGQQMRQYCKAETACLRNILLSVFGYSKDRQENVDDKFRCCDVCST